jgi:Raf kinase inhibitor-like YbhB/YbcL family protein
MEIQSPAFEQHKPIPAKYTCEGQNVSPPLSIRDIPSGTKSLALIMDDPDAPMGTFDHWIVWNLPADTKILDEGASFPNQGKNHFKEVRYGGPCPPKGSNPHRYFFKLFALDGMIDLPKGSSKDQLEDAMEGHIIGKAELVGTYQRN